MGPLKFVRQSGGTSGVIRELDAIMHAASAPKSHGPLDGKLLPNDKFTLTAWTQQAQERNFSVVHTASHFVLGSSEGLEPCLMLGGKDAAVPAGSALTVSHLEASDINFKGTELPTLFACSTATDYTSQNGIEMDNCNVSIDTAINHSEALLYSGEDQHRKAESAHRNEAPTKTAVETMRRHLPDLETRRRGSPQ